jgi:histidine phosphotransfer protein HptB
MHEIDKAATDQLKELFGGVFVNDLIDVFLQEAPKMLGELQTGLATSDADQFHRAAHSLKSNAATFGANNLAEMAKALEQLGREKKLAEVGSLLTELEAEYAGVASQLLGLKS